MANARRSAGASARLSRIAREPRRIEVQRTGPAVQVTIGGDARSWKAAWDSGIISINEVPTRFLAEVCQ